MKEHIEDEKKKFTDRLSINLMKMIDIKNDIETLFKNLNDAFAKYDESILEPDLKNILSKVISEIKLDLAIKKKDIENIISDIFNIENEAGTFLSSIREGKFTGEKNAMSYAISDYITKIKNLSDNVLKTIYKIENAISVYDIQKESNPLSNEIKSFITSQIEKLLSAKGNEILKIPQETMDKFNEINNCDNMNCIKDQIKFLQETIVNQNITIEKITELVMDKIEDIGKILEKYDEKIDGISSGQNTMKKDFNSDLSRLKFSLSNRIDEIEKQNDILNIKKYI